MHGHLSVAVNFLPVLIGQRHFSKWERYDSWQCRVLSVEHQRCANKTAQGKRSAALGCSSHHSQSPARAQQTWRRVWLRPCRAFYTYGVATQGGASLCPGLSCLRTFGAPWKNLHIARTHYPPNLKSGAVQLAFARRRANAEPQAAEPDFAAAPAHSCAAAVGHSLPFAHLLKIATGLVDHQPTRWKRRIALPTRVLHEFGSGND